MTFYSIVRQWCKEYIYMKDNEEEGNRRFYLTDSTAGTVEFAKNIANTLSPCVLMESDVDGYMRSGLIFRNYPVYFYVRASDMADGDAAAAAKEEAWMHAQNFITWLRVKHEDDPTSTREFERINMEDNLYVQSVGPLENGWFAVLVQFERCEQTDLCIDESLYEDTCDCSSSSL